MDLNAKMREFKGLTGSTPQTAEGHIRVMRWIRDFTSEMSALKEKKQGPKVTSEVFAQLTPELREMALFGLMSVSYQALDESLTRKVREIAGPERARKWSCGR